MSVDVIEEPNVGSSSTLCAENGVTTIVNNAYDSTIEIKALRNELDTVRAHNEALEDNNLDLRAQLAAKQQTEKDLQEQLKVLSQFAINSGSAHQKQVDLQRMYDQMCYKDNRMVELNNIIMEKERQIMDLQEMCRERSQVAEAKSMAVQIEYENKKYSDMSTETDFSFSLKEKKNGREISPGRAVPQFRMNGSNPSPPPIDPAEDVSSYTTETVTNQEECLEFDREWSTSPSPGSKKKYRKRVTFDLRAPKAGTPTPTTSTVKSEESVIEDRESLAQAVVDLSSENDQLRRTIAEMEKSQHHEEDKEGVKIAALEEEAEQARRDARNQTLRARAAAQAKIKDLETKLLELRVNSSKEIEALKASVNAITLSRDWSLVDNSKLLEQIGKLKLKLDDLRGELDASNDATSLVRQRIDAEERRYENLAGEVKAMNMANQQLQEEKSFLVNEIERLNDDIAHQQDLINQMEGDLIVYEAHVSMLRESLSMTKTQEQQLIKSKAFTAKLALLEKEKAVISKRNNDEKIRTKALNTKIRDLEKQRDELLETVMNARGLLQQYEESKGSGRKSLASSSVSSNGEDQKDASELNVDITNDNNDTNPQFEEREILEKDNQSQEKLYHHVQEILPSFTMGEPTPIVPTAIKFLKNSAFQPLTTSQSRDTVTSISNGSQNSQSELEQAVQSLQSENDAERAAANRLATEVHQLRDNQTQVILVLNHFLHEICTQLRQKDQLQLADQMTADLENYAKQPELDLITIVKHVQRFVDEVIEVLLHELFTVRSDKTKVAYELKYTKDALSEMETLNKELEDIKQHMEADTNTLQLDWQKVKAQLLQRKQSSEAREDAHPRFSPSIKQEELVQHLSSTEQIEAQTINEQVAEKDIKKLRDEKEQLQQNLIEMKKKATALTIELDHFEQTVKNLQDENTLLKAEHEQTFQALREHHQQNAQLEQLVEQLKAQVENNAKELKDDEELQVGSGEGQLVVDRNVDDELEQLRSDKRRLEQQLIEMDKKSLELIIERTLRALRDQEQQNRQLEQLVEQLRSQIDNAPSDQGPGASAAVSDEHHDALSVSDEVNQLRDNKQRLENKLTDMDKKTLEMIIEREEFEHKIKTLEAESIHRQTEHEQTFQTLHEQQQRNLQLEQIVEQLRSQIDSLRVEAELSRNCLEDLRCNGPSTTWTQQQIPQPQNSPQEQVNKFLLASADATAREALQYCQQNHFDQQQAFIDQVHQQIQEAHEDQQRHVDEHQYLHEHNRYQYSQHHELVHCAQHFDQSHQQFIQPPGQNESIWNNEDGTVPDEEKKVVLNDEQNNLLASETEDNNVSIKEENEKVVDNMQQGEYSTRDNQGKTVPVEEKEPDYIKEVVGNDELATQEANGTDTSLHQVKTEKEDKPHDQDEGFDNTDSPSEAPVTDDYFSNNSEKTRKEEENWGWGDEQEDAVATPIKKPPQLQPEPVVEQQADWGWGDDEVKEPKKSKPLVLGKPQPKYKEPQDWAWQEEEQEGIKADHAKQELEELREHQVQRVISQRPIDQTQSTREAAEWVWGEQGALEDEEETQEQDGWDEW